MASRLNTEMGDRSRVYQPLTPTRPGHPSPGRRSEYWRWSWPH